MRPGHRNLVHQVGKENRLVSLSGGEHRRQRKTLPVGQQMDLGREAPAKDRQVHNRGPGSFPAPLDWFGPLFAVVGPTGGSAACLNNRAVHIELTPVDQAFGVELALQVTHDPLELFVGELIATSRHKRTAGSVNQAVQAVQTAFLSDNA